jgi:hypothetical protein
VCWIELVQLASAVLGPSQNPLALKALLPFASE